jgi:hypothetical protein
MLNNSKYNHHCSKIGVKALPHQNYCDYEKLWQNYVDNIVIPTLKIKKPCCVRLVLCESCPRPVNNVQPHQNYIFNNLENFIKWPEDMYLHQIYKGIKYESYIDKKLTKGQALKDLVNHINGPVIIVDLLPTHGIRLTTKKRVNVNLNPYNTVDINKFVLLIKTLSKYCSSNQLTVKAIFATPPSLQTSIIVSAIDPSLNVCWVYQTSNIGQGHVPSWREISKKITNGSKCS